VIYQLVIWGVRPRGVRQDQRVRSKLAAAGFISKSRPQVRFQADMTFRGTPFKPLQEG
jgi:hypothetical protein